MVPTPDSCSQGQAWSSGGVSDSYTSSLDFTVWGALAPPHCFLWQFSLSSRLPGFTGDVWSCVLLIVSSMTQTFPQG